mgnify:FL=1
MDRELNQKQKDILSYIISVQSSKGYIPTYREICAANGQLSTATAQRYIKSLEDAGYLRRMPGQSRALEILKDVDGSPYGRTYRQETLEDLSSPLPGVLPELPAVPIVGRVTAGEPILAVENIEDYFPLPVDLAHNSDVFMLHVRGESMINAGIFDGDLILVRQQNTARNGDYVVALLGEDVTVKTFYKEDGYIRLQPENDRLAPILVKECTILGKVIGLYRKM